MTCYDNTGIVSDNIPCDPNAEVSACCGAGSVCVTNLYCSDPSGNKVPGTCTSQTWVDIVDGCPCPGDGGLNYANSVTFCSDGSYCCGKANINCCNQGLGFAEIFFGQSAIIPSGTTALSSYYAGLQVTTSSIHRSSSTSSSSTTTAPGFVTTTFTVSSIPTSSSASQPTRKTSSGLSSGAGIGIGVGICGFAILALALGFWAFKFWKLRKRKDKGDIKARSDLSETNRQPTSGLEVNNGPVNSVHHHHVPELSEQRPWMSEMAAQR